MHAHVSQYNITTARATARGGTVNLELSMFHLGMSVAEAERVVEALQAVLPEARRHAAPPAPTSPVEIEVDQTTP